jgi:hypothetical protein
MSLVMAVLDRGDSPVKSGADLDPAELVVWARRRVPAFQRARLPMPARGGRSAVLLRRLKGLSGRSPILMDEAAQNVDAFDTARRTAAQWGCVSHRDRDLKIDGPMGLPVL